MNEVYLRSLFVIFVLQWVSSVCAMPDNIRVVSGSFDKSLRVWDVTKGHCICSLLGHMAVSDTTTTTTFTTILLSSVSNPLFSNYCYLLALCYHSSLLMWWHLETNRRSFLDRMTRRCVCGTWTRRSACMCWINTEG
jgi:WD40 repeat protein